MVQLGRMVWSAALVVAGLLGVTAVVHADSPPVAEPQAQTVLTMERALAWALQLSPELAVVRKQRGLAAANVVIAKTYPFNPIWQSFTMPDSGPSSAGVTNRVFIENTFRLDLELCGQGKMRIAAAAAGVSRTEWEIAAQELSLAVRVVRAFNTFVYRQEKLRLLDDTIQLQEQNVATTKALADQGKLRPADVILANSDLLELRAARGPANSLLVTSWNDLRRTIGVELNVANYEGKLEAWAPTVDAETLTPHALELRPDLRALQQAIVEADQRVRLEIANRLGNPSIGPGMEYNETRVAFFGAWLVYPLPVLNTRRGDIMLRQAERDRVVADRRRVEIQTALDVQAALARSAEAQRSVKYFAEESLPALGAMLQSFEKLFAANEPGVDVLRLIDTRRRVQRARDAYLDTLWELSQARADLAAAVGDLSLAIGAPPTAPQPAALQPAAAQPVAAPVQPASEVRAWLLPPVSPSH